MSNCLKFHKFHKYFKFILLTALFKYFNNCLLAYNYNESFEDVSIYKLLYKLFNLEVKTNIPDFRMVEFFLNYIGALIFSFLSRLYELKITEKKIEEFFQINDPNAVNQREMAIAHTITLTTNIPKEENILYKFKNYLLNNSSIFINLVISFIWVSDEIIMFVIFNYLKDVDFWFFEILIVTIIYSKIFLVQIYKHQKFAIILNLIPSILKIACIILTIKSDDQSLIYTEYSWWIPIGFLIHSTLTAIISFINCSLKSFLDLKYITASQLLMFYSLVGIFISFLICIISTYVPCSSIDNNKNSFSEMMCKVKDNAYFYFDSFKIYFKTYSEESSSENFIRTIIIIFDSLTFFFFKYFFLLSIQYTDPVHIYFYIPIYYVFQKTILVLNNVIMDNKCFKDTSNYKVAKYFLDIGGDFFCLIGFLIYLEVIELNFCELNYNLKRNIAKRSISNDLVNFKKLFDDEYEDDKESISSQKIIEMGEK